MGPSWDKGLLCIRWQDRFLPAWGGGGGMVEYVCRHFRILFVDSGFLKGEGGSSSYSSLGMNMALKN